jgi:cell wall-associated NlpC family hydrolase
MSYKIGIDSREFENIEERINKLGFPWEKIENPRVQIKKLVREQIGKPYKYGASVLKDAPNSFDCSSFTSWVYVQLGISLPRISVDQYAFGEEVSLADAHDGDLIFSNTHINIRNVFRSETVELNPGTKIPKPIDHCGILIGNNVIHASGSSGVIEEELSTSKNFQDIAGIRKIKGMDGTKYLISVPNNKLSAVIKEGILSKLKQF